MVDQDDDVAARLTAIEAQLGQLSGSVMLLVMALGRFDAWHTRTRARIATFAPRAVLGRVVQLLRDRSRRYRSRSTHPHYPRCLR